MNDLVIIPPPDKPKASIRRWFFAKTVVLADRRPSPVASHISLEKIESAVGRKNLPRYSDRGLEGVSKNT